MNPHDGEDAYMYMYIPEVVCGAVPPPSHPSLVGLQQEPPRCTLWKRSSDPHKACHEHPLQPTGVIIHMRTSTCTYIAKIPKAKYCFVAHIIDTHVQFFSSCVCIGVCHASSSLTVAS